MIVVPAPAAETQTGRDVTNDVHLNTGGRKCHAEPQKCIYYKVSQRGLAQKYLRLYLLTLVLAGLEDVHEPLQLVARISGVHQQPEVFSGAEVHVQGDNSEARLDLHGVESSMSGEDERQHSFTSQA